MSFHLLWINEEVLWFDVAMDHVIAMAVLDCLEQLVDEATDLIEFDSVGVLFEDLEQVLVEVLKHQVQTVAPNRRELEKSRLFLLI